MATSKNQTAAARALLRQAQGTELSVHTCASPDYPDHGHLIALGDLYPVVQVAPRRKTLFFHRQCAPTGTQARRT